MHLTDISCAALRGPQVVNNAEVLASLRDLGSALGMKVRPYTVTTQAHFTSYVATMAKTGVLVARHGPLLGNAVFLPPGGCMGGSLGSKGVGR